MDNAALSKEKQELLRRLLAQKAEKARNAQMPNGSAGRILPVPRADSGQALPLSLGQQRLWFIDQLEGQGIGEPSAYHIFGAVRLHGELDETALQCALGTIVARHEVLRTRFEPGAGQAKQVIAAELPFDLGRTDVGLESQVPSLARAEAQRPFDLAHGPLIRGRLLRLGGQEHVLLVSMHHIVSDGWSVGVLIQELQVLYAAFSAGKPNPLPPLALQYADYAAWQTQRLQGQALQGELAFWKAHLQGAPALLDLPTDRPRPAVQSHRGDSVKLVLDEALVRQLKAFTRKHDATLHMVLYAAWTVLLSRLSGQDDVVVGTPVANRLRTEVEPLIGFFVNTLALRLQVWADEDVASLLARVKAQTLAAYGHQELPFEQVVEALNPPRSLAHGPVFQNMFVLQTRPRGRWQLPGLEMQALELPQQTAQFDLTLALEEQGDRIEGTLNYATDLFEPATVARWAGHLEALLQAMVHDDTQAVGALPLMREDERWRVLQSFNEAGEAYPAEQLVHGLIEAQAVRSPDAVAVTDAGRSISYAELNARANQLARTLR
ncbi:condensation domain-containing protein, partial [Rhizobacter sp. Root1221]|uniref:condensation domain-containing protein n=1 Tax=Rhizobacter sp. Root1221 TaxID=1736433 RepID=UPI001F395B8D